MEDIFGYYRTPPPRSLRREVIKWLQSLDLTHAVKDPRRDLANGFLVAEVLTRYFPNVVDMHSFTNGLSMASRSNNWGQIVKFFLRRGTPLSDELVEGTMNMQYMAAHHLMDHLYEMLTMRKLPELPQAEEPQAHARTSSSDVQAVPASQVFQFASMRPVTMPEAAKRSRQSRGANDDMLATSRQGASTRRGRRRGQQQEGPGALAGAAPINATAVESVPVQFGTIKLAHLDNVADLRKTMAQS